MITTKHGSGRDPRVFKDAPTNVESTTLKIRSDPAGHEAAAFHGKKAVGFIDYDPIAETVGSVFVSKQFRGLETPPRVCPTAGSPRHSNRLTEQGEAWARRVGGEMPAQHEIVREPPLQNAGYRAMIPQMDRWIDEAATRTSRYTTIRQRGD